MTRSRRALLALLLALPAAFGFGLVATGVARISDGRVPLGVGLVVAGGALIAVAMRGLRRINAGAERS